MEMEDRNKKRMEELKKLIDERKSEIDDEIVPGAYYYDVDRVNQLQKELDEFSNEYEELSEIPTLERVEADIRDLNTKLDEVNEELKEANGSYFLTDDMQELEDQRKEILEQLADREETKSMIEEVTRLEAEVKALKEDEKDYNGAYFIPEELTNEIKEKEARIAELEEKIKGKKVTTKEVDLPKEKKEDKEKDENDNKENDGSVKSQQSIEHVKPAERTENGENVKYPPEIRGTRSGKWEVESSTDEKEENDDPKEGNEDEKEENDDPYNVKNATNEQLLTRYREMEEAMRVSMQESMDPDQDIDINEYRAIRAELEKRRNDKR